MTFWAAIDGRHADALRELIDPSKFQSAAAVTLTMKKRVVGVMLIQSWRQKTSGTS